MVDSYFPTITGINSLDSFWENKFYRQRTTDARASAILALLTQLSRAKIPKYYCTLMVIYMYKAIKWQICFSG